MVGFGSAGLRLAADAQQPAKVHRIGYLSVAGPSASDRTPKGCPTRGGSNWQALTEGLREYGYVPGKNLVVECRFTEGHEERAPAFAAELVNLKVDLLLVHSTTNVRAAKEATSTIPIVMYGVIDRVGRGLVANLARPGGNVTGLTDDAGKQVTAKHLQLLKEAIPRVSRVAVLGYVPEHGPHEYIWLADLQAAAERQNLALLYHYVDDPEELEGAFRMMREERAGALVVLSHPFMGIHRRRIAELAAQSGLPAIYPSSDFIAEGGLLTYGADLPALRRRIAFYVNKILTGARPADLPVEQPTKFVLTVNLKTVKELGLAIPRALLLRADEVIE